MSHHQTTLPQKIRQTYSMLTRSVSLKKSQGYLLHQEVHAYKECSFAFKPLRLFVSDVGGTGKSILIEVIKASIQQQDAGILSYYYQIIRMRPDENTCTQRHYTLHFTHNTCVYVYLFMGPLSLLYMIHILYTLHIYACAESDPLIIQNNPLHIQCKFSNKMCSIDRSFRHCHFSFQRNTLQQHTGVSDIITFKEIAKSMSFIHCHFISTK